MKVLLLAITFLTRLPLPVSKKIAPEDMGKVTPYFPLIGLLIGAILLLINYLTSFFWQSFVVNVILIVSLAIITGGLHLDGLMDTCDGIFSGKSRERALEIMKDSRVGAMGVLGAICVIGLKIAFLSSIKGDSRLSALLTFPMYGRWSMAFVIPLFPYARTEPGLGTLFVEYARKSYILWATIQILVATILLLLWKAFPIFIVIASITWLMGSRLSFKLKGLTGDTYGAICEIVETLALAMMSVSYIGKV